MISQKVGSFFFICEIITDLELEYDNPTTDHCGSCTACIDACPTEALIEPYQIDGSKCISYLTIEKRTVLNRLEAEMIEDWIFGCDHCSNVCPPKEKIDMLLQISTQLFYRVRLLLIMNLMMKLVLMLSLIHI